MSTTPTTVKELIRGTLQASKDHQYALKVYTERLEAELEAVDKLLAAAEAPDDEPDVDVGGHITIAGTAKATGPIPSDIAPGEHPFVEDATKRHKYLQYTTIHQMKASDFDALADAVRSENHRIHALAAQKRGQQPFVGLNDHPQSYFEQNKEGINWERVAQRVTAATSNPVQRTAQECEIRWLGERHPDFDRSQWSQSEINKVKQLVGNAKEGEVDWVDIAVKLGTGRTPIDCMRHAIPRKTHVWSQESDQRLMDMVKVYGTENWQLVARHVSEDATANQCQNRYTRTLDPQLRRGPWTQEEDDQLRRAVEIFGRSWVDVRTYVPTRSNEQCRDRWQDVLNPGVGKGKWTDREDQVLLAACEELGERWKEISQRVGGGRTDNMCRHRYGLISKRKSKRRTASSTPGETSLVTPEPVSGPSQPHLPSHPPASTEDGSCSETPVLESSVPPAKAKPKPRPRARRVEAPREHESMPQTEQQDVSLLSTAAASSGSGCAVEIDPNIAESEDLTSQSILIGDETVQKQMAPQRRARQRKRPQPDEEASGDPATKKRRTRKGRDSGKSGVVDTANLTQVAAGVEDVQSEVNAALSPEQTSMATDSAEASASKRGRKKHGDPASRPTPTRQSARLRDARTT